MAQINVAAEVRIDIRHTVDVERARRAARSLANSLDFDTFDEEMVVLSVSELATNLVRYAMDGYLLLRPIASPLGVAGIEVESRDHGPGLTESRTRAHGSASLGAGLAAVRRLMDLFELQTAPAGTTVLCRKWRTSR